jgi:hypothetical protein
MVVEYRPQLAECRHVVDAFFSQILHDAQHGPRQHQAQAQKQQQSDLDMHGRAPNSRAEPEF